MEQYRDDWDGSVSIPEQAEDAEPVAEHCPNALLPDGPRCPRCGGERGPSGVDGGSWVHVGTEEHPDHNSHLTLSTRIFNYQEQWADEHVFSCDYESQAGTTKAMLASKKRFNMISEETGKLMKFEFRKEGYRGIEYKAMDDSLSKNGMNPDHIRILAFFQYDN